MTILSAAQSAGIRLLGVKPASLTAGDDAFATELFDLATDVAIDIAKSHDWQALTKLATLTGDGSSLAFNLPTDYDRMPIKAKLHSKTWQTATFRAARDLDEWINLQTTNWGGTPGTWLVLGGKVQIFPAMSASETARFYYISSAITAEGKKAFTTDGDVFVLSERLLTLGLIWRWRAQKRMEYAEDMAIYEKALSEEVLRDRGSRMITVGSRRWGDVHIAYPGQLG